MAVLRISGGLTAAAFIVCGASFATVASSSTMSVQALVENTFQDIHSIAEIDTLGYDCIPEDKIDIAFHLASKGVRMPRTCLPNPCTHALETGDLAQLIGRPPTQEEWDDYYARYADQCRAETIPSKPEPQTPRTELAEAFWKPLLASYPADAPVRRSAGGLPFMGLSQPVSGHPLGGTSSPYGDTETPLPLEEDKLSIFDTPLDSEPGDNYPVDIYPNPLPPSLLLFASAFLAVSALARRKMRRRAEASNLTRA